MYFSMILNTGAEQPFCRSPFRGWFWTYSAHFLWSDLHVFILNLTLGQVCFKSFLICKNPIVRTLLPVLKLFVNVVTTVHLQIYPFIQNSGKKVFKRRKNKKSMELFWENEMFLKIAALKVTRWNFQSKSLNIHMNKFII